MAPALAPCMLTLPAPRSSLLTLPPLQDDTLPRIDLPPISPHSIACVGYVPKRERRSWFTSELRVPALLRFGVMGV